MKMTDDRIDNIYLNLLWTSGGFVEKTGEEEWKDAIFQIQQWNRGKLFYMWWGIDKEIVVNV